MSSLRRETPTESPVPARIDPEEAAPANDTISPRDLPEAHQAALSAVERVLAAKGVAASPRVAVVEHQDSDTVYGSDTVYVSTAVRLGPGPRADIRGAVRAVLAPFAKLAPSTNVVFLTRGNL